MVEGPWWYLKQIFLSSEIEDQNGDAAERSSYVFQGGTLDTHLAALIARAIAMGAPIRAGSVAACFVIPRLTLQNMSFADAFAELMRWLADGHLFFDYTGDDGEYPALCMQRRGTADAITLTPAETIVPAIDISPRLDLVVEQTHVIYAQRETVNNRRVTTWKLQTAGSSVSGLPRRQPITVSGPEMDTWLPADITDSTEVKSRLLEGHYEDALSLHDGRIIAAGSPELSIAPYMVTNNLGQTYALPATATRLTDASGAEIPEKYAYYLTKGEVKSWWTADGVDHIMARLTGTLFGGHTSWGYFDDEADDPEWAQALNAKKHYWLTLVGGLLTRNRIYAYSTTVSMPLVTTSWDLETTLIRQEDYEFIVPP
ncbi:MAG TPA: hypothetical protein VF258_11065, partial [Luteolibacter sp.]